MRLMLILLLALLWGTRAWAADWLDRLSDHEHCAAHYQTLSNYDGAFADEFMAQATAGRDLALQTLAEIDAGDRPDDQWYRDMAAPWPTLEFYVGSEFGRKVAAIADRTRWEFCSARIDGVQKFQCTMVPTAFFDRETFHAHLHDLIEQRRCEDLLAGR